MPIAASRPSRTSARRALASRRPTALPSMLAGGPSRPASGDLPQVRGLVQAPHAALTGRGGEETRDAGVGDVEEERIGDPEHVAGPGVDHAAVTHERDASTRVRGDRALDRRDDVVAERVEVNARV